SGSYRRARRLVGALPPSALGRVLTRRAPDHSPRHLLAGRPHRLVDVGLDERLPIGGDLLSAVNRMICLPRIARISFQRQKSTVLCRCCADVGDARAAYSVNLELLTVAHVGNAYQIEPYRPPVRPFVASQGRASGRESRELGASARRASEVPLQC